LEELNGLGSVLTAAEDIYVYSHLGPMGVKRAPEPVAVLRPNLGNEDALMEAASKLGMHVVRLSERQLTPQEEAYLLLDDEKPLGLAELEDAILEQRRRLDENRETRKSAGSAHQYAVALLQSKEGFRLEADTGYCVVHRFLDGVETYSSRGRLLLCRGLANGDLVASERLADAIFSCTACGQCYDQHTQSPLEINNAIVDARHKVVSQGMQPAKCRLLMGNLLNKGNPMGLEPEDRTIWYMDAAEEHVYRGNSVLYWPGCTTSYRLPEAVEATIKVLAYAGVDFGILGERERCCGLALYLLGQWEEARGYAAQLAKELGEMKPEALVTSCAGCYYAFKKVYPGLGAALPFKVLHTSELYSGLLKAGLLPSMKSGETYMWHDPCDLGRHSHVYDPPRRVLGAVAGSRLVDPVLSREAGCGRITSPWPQRLRCRRSVRSYPRRSDASSQAALPAS
jgi:Fe-S oxidoreductase